ncbi:unnamed protein product [Ascophyllum nodosum]
MKRWLSRREMSRSRVKGGRDEGTTETAWACAVCSRTRTAAVGGAQMRFLDDCGTSHEPSFFILHSRSTVMHAFWTQTISFSILLQR